MSGTFFSQAQIAWLAEQIARTTRNLPDGTQRDMREAVKDLVLSITNTNPKVDFFATLAIAAPRPKASPTAAKCADGITRFPPQSKEISQFRAYDSAEKLGF